MNLYQSLLVASKYAKQGWPTTTTGSKCEPHACGRRTAERVIPDIEKANAALLEWLPQGRGKAVSAIQVAVKFKCHSTTATKRLKQLHEIGKVLRYKDEKRVYWYWRKI